MMRSRTAAWWPMLPLCVVCAGCTGDADPAPSGLKPRGSTATSQPDVASTPSTCRPPTETPHDELPAALRSTEPDNVWIGENGLWIEVSSAIQATAAAVDGEYRYKFATVTLVDGRLSPRPGPPSIEVRPLDGSGEGAGGFGGYASSGEGALHHWWPTTLEFSTSGCWQVTERSAGTEVSFQVQVP